MPNKAQLEVLKEEALLINNLKEGSIEAFEKIFTSYYATLVNYANTILKDWETAEDIVQQVFISIWEKKQTLEIHSSFKAMLYKSVYNACLNFIKKEQVRSNYAQESLKQPIEQASMEHSFLQKELQTKIETAIEQLPEQCAKIFKMSRIEQLKYAEIADRLGLSIKTIENQMGKALKILRVQLKDYLPLIILYISRNYFD